MELARRRLGRTGVEVTILGLGGEGVLRTFGRDREAYDLINLAIDLGITYCESARAYSGSESYYGKALGERRREIFLTSKSHARDKKGAVAHLTETLASMKTDYLDLWQVHDVREEEEVVEIFGPGGAIEAFAEAKQKGIVRFIGVTGHHDPRIIGKCIDLIDFDTVLIPVNPAEDADGGFIRNIIPHALRKDMGIIAMKTYFHGFAGRLPGFRGFEPFYRFALSQEVSTAVIGCDSLEQLRENLRFAASFVSMTDREREDLSVMISPYTDRLRYYRP